MIEVLKDKCTTCQLCMNDCPSKIIRKDEDGFPYLAKRAEPFCIDCGHCFSICPTGALKFKGEVSNKNTNNSIGINAKELEALIKQRRSIRHYKEDLVPKETLESLLALTQYTPSGSNARPVHFTIVSGKETTDHLTDLCLEWVKENNKYTELIPEMRRDNNLITCGAPHLIFAHAENNTETTYIEDGIIALSTIELAAQAYHIGACWGGYLKMITQQSNKIRKYLKIKNDHKICGVIMLGYSKFQYRRLAPRKINPINWE